MASPLQNRIVGTVILVALAVIFLPDLLDGEKVQRDEELETIPLRPELSMQQRRGEFSDDFDQRISEADPVTEDLQAVDENGREEFTAPREPVSVTLGGDVESPAWVVRLGAFRNVDNVQRLVEELQDAGYNAYTRKAQNDDGELHVLLVGPDLKRDVLSEQLSELKDLTGLQGQVIPYRPNPE